ncbi:hypothetical protein SAMN04488503_2245 [Humidesulfovibrio mexicanus]|uniref:DUF7694 domain-containing protein n=1 Tax=Humidesulfovibrio mexicanus TaxID=147047 RepID=A0A239AX63_9BACT|nr:hypothetical protein [Humidesulfovibrio mexicanus]SNR99553.1 hypothetical protein SAMN04488503_2245 [Humidesulfovibrio mexicanus]
MLQRIIATTPARPGATLAPEWKPVGVFPYGTAWANHRLGLRVIMSVDTLVGDERYLHVSCSRKSRLPSWDDLKVVKDVFIGEEVEAIQCLPKKSEYVNLMPHCLHLWARVTAP